MLKSCISACTSTFSISSALSRPSKLQYLMVVPSLLLLSARFFHFSINTRYASKRSARIQKPKETASRVPLVLKDSITPSRLLDPSKERRMIGNAPTLREMAFEEKELSDLAFEAFDVDLEARAIDKESLSLTQLDGLVEGQHKQHPMEQTKTNQNSAIIRDGDYKKAVIAIVGRPNVGKSTLFNRIIRKSKSLITNLAGTTRDRKYGFTTWEDYPMIVVDTGGMCGDGDAWAEDIHEQAQVAIEQADVIILLTNFEDGVHIHDKTLAKMLRKTEKPVILAVNKCDNEARYTSEEISKFKQLGLGEPIPISASHGLGTGDLFDSFIPHLRLSGFSPVTPSASEEHFTPVTPDKLVTTSAFNPDGTRKNIRVAIVGVPNVGKSSLLNQLLGSKRSVVSPTPGTTTDPVDEQIIWKEKFPITLIDTAGVRKKKSQEGHIEKLSALWSLKVIESAHVSILLIDASIGAQHQDIRLSSYIIDNYRSCIVVVNKWDLAPDKSINGMQSYEEQLREKLQFWYFVPVVFASAKTGFNVDSIMAWVIRVGDERRIHLTTRRLFQILEQASIVKPPPSKGKKHLRFRYCTQVNLGGGPTFVFFVNHPDLVTGPYSRFLEGFIRQHHSFTGTPVRLMFRANQSKSLPDRKVVQEKASKRKKTSTSAS